MRAFIALEPPSLLTAQLALMGGGIPGARWQAADKMHLTLVFVGDIEGRELSCLHDTLARVEHEPFTLQPASVGHFPPRGDPRSLWAGVHESPSLMALQRKVSQAATTAGLEPDRRNFAPHITLARLRNAPATKVAAFLGRHALFSAPPFTADRFGLFSSVRSRGGSHYRAEAWFPLDDAR